MLDPPASPQTASRGQSWDLHPGSAISRAQFPVPAAWGPGGRRPHTGMPLSMVPPGIPPRNVCLLTCQFSPHSSEPDEAKALFLSIT